MFKNINFSSDVFLKYLEMHFINQDDRELFMNLINQDYISISGSSILQIIQQEFYQNTDLDIYIEITNFDNLLTSYTTVFQVMTKEGWTSIMYNLMNVKTDWMVCSYFIGLIVIGAFFLL